MTQLGSELTADTSLVRTGGARISFITYDEDPSMWYQHEAIALCKKLEEIAPQFGAHVALTGGCLYKEGAREDCDIMFYRIRQEEVDEEALLAHLVKFEGFKLGRRLGWVQKATYDNKEVDLFFPNTEVAEYVPSGAPGQHADSGY